MSISTYIIICVVLVTIIFVPFIYAAVKESQRQKIEEPKQQSQNLPEPEVTIPQDTHIEMMYFMALDYNGLVNELIKKYGKAKHNYFMKSQVIAGVMDRDGRNSRTDEGLITHHIDENRYPGLSNKRIFEENFQRRGGLTDYQVKLIKEDFQKADRLVYCNLMEHLLLHVKAFESQLPLVEGEEIASRGAKILADDVRRALTGRIGMKVWEKNVAKAISGKWNEYLDILEYAHNIAKIDGFSRLITFAEQDKNKTW